MYTLTLIITTITFSTHSTSHDVTKTPAEWAEADLHFKQNIVPLVLMESNVDTINPIVCQGIYSFFTSKFGFTPDTPHPTNHRCSNHHQSNLNKIKKEKIAVKKQLRHLRRFDGNRNEVRLLAQRFHQLVRSHNKLIKIEKQMQTRGARNQQRKKCHKDIHKFARNLLNNDDFTSIEPTFSRSEAEDFFSTTYSSTPRSFNCPPWMPVPPQPSTPLTTEDFTIEEIRGVISKARSSSSPCPLDQVSYTILKKCPSLLPALHHLFNICWLSQTVPSAWKVAVIKLIGKKRAKEDPSLPSNFRPIALTSCVGKIYTSLLKNHWMTYMLENKYLNTAVQKAFVDGLPGCTEHHLKLLSILNEARQKHKSLCICWLDLANTFGSVHHNLIGFAFRRYHAPPTFINIITNLYQNLYGIVSTPNQLACPIQLQRGVYQGDPLCWCLTLAVMNTLLDTIAHCHPDHGYRLGCFPQRTNTLQYADKTTLITDQLSITIGYY
jgi:hypothetical protein